MAAEVTPAGTPFFQNQAIRLTIFPVAISEGQRAFRMQHGIHLVPVHRNELIVGHVLHFLQIIKLNPFLQKMVKS
jgi:hypothetical protein